MKRLIYLAALAGAMLHGQPLTISDTITTPMGGNWSGTVVVTLNNPQTAQPLYAGSVTLSGWSQTVTVTAGSFSISLYPNDTITPSGTSYTARYTPTSGSAWSETWVVPTGATTIREIRSTTVPTPSVRFNPAQLNQAGATLGQALRWNGSTWAPGTFVADPMTTTGDLITRSGGVPVRVGIGSTGQVLTVAGGLPTWASGISGNAATATALAANGTNCSAGQFPLGVDASGNSEGCTALPTTIAGTTNQITASAATGSVVLSFPAGGVTLPGTTTGTFSGNLTGNVTGNVTGSSGSTTGNAATATVLQTARTIAGVSFNGSANIAIPSTGLSDSSDLIRASGSYSNPTWLTALAGSKITGNIPGAAATLSTPRTIAGVSFDGSANIAIPSTGLSDTAQLVRNNAANTYSAGSKQTFASNTTTAGAAFGGAITADPSSVVAGDLWYRSDLGTFGFRNASAVDALVAGGRAVASGQVLFGTAPGVAGSEAGFAWSNAGNIRTLTLTDGSSQSATGNLHGNYSGGNAKWRIGGTNNGLPSMQFFTSAAAQSFYILNAGPWRVWDVGNNGLAFGVNNAETARFAATTGNLLIGTTTDDGSNRLQVAGSVYTTGPLRADNNDNFFGNLTTGTFLNLGSLGDASNAWIDARGTGTNVGLTMRVKGSGSFTFTGPTHGLATLAVDGTFTVRNQVPSTGVTQLIVRAGAGQSSTNLQTWQNAAGTDIAQVNSFGDANFRDFYSLQNTLWLRGAGSTFDIESAFQIRFSSTSVQSGVKDLSFSRAAANTGRIGDGGANANGNLQYREWQGTARAFASLGTPANGTFVYCDNCTVANPCASGGTGALAKRLNGAWVCN